MNLNNLVTKIAQTTLLLFAFLFGFFSLFTFVTPAQADDNTPTVSITTDKLDYSPWETVTVNGTGLSPIHSYSLTIFSNDPPAVSYTSLVNTDVSGSFSSSYTLDGLYRPHYTANLYDGTTLVATIDFNDSAIGTYDQCSNDDGDGYATGDNGCRWVNGNLQSSNSAYFEGDSTVQRLWLTGFVPESTHTVTLKYGTTKQGKHAYDFLTSWDHSEGWISLADRCQDIGGCTTAGENTYAIPQDSSANNFDNFARNFAMRGGSITGVSTPTIVSGTYAGDSETAVTVSFTTAVGGDMCETKGQNTTCGVALWFGAHIAKQDEWSDFNGTLGATSIPGSPYHVSLEALDGGSIGSRDNQMQAGAIVVPTGHIIVDKVTVPSGDSQSFDFAVTGTNYQNFSLTDAAFPNDQTLPVGVYTVAETIPAGWTQTSATCSDGSPISVIDLADGETVTCTVTNTKEARLTLNKTVVNDNGGTATLADFQGKIDDSSVSWGTSNIVSVGSHTASEISLPTYSASVWGGDCNEDGTITIAAGDNKVCSITNDDIAPTLTVNKVVIPSSDSGLFNLQIDGLSEAEDVVDGGTTGAVTVSAGSHIAGEIAGTGSDLSHYVTTFSGDCDASGNVSLALAENKTCTITNTRKGHLIVDKITLPSGDPQSFSFTATGTGYTNFALTDSDNPNDQELAPGVYGVSESALTGWDQTSTICDDGSAISSIDLSAGETVTCTFTNTKRSNLTIVKDAEPNDLQDFQFGGTLGAFALDDDAGMPEATADLLNSKSATGIVAGAYTIGETEPNNFWVLDSASCVTTGTSDVYPSTLSGTSLSLNLDPGVDVTCTFKNKKLGPTRTQGFWQTHTDFTGSVFGSSAMKRFVGVDIAPTLTSHKGQITNTQVLGSSQLFGAYYASISMKSGTKGKAAQRLPVDQARMILLQQLVTAKLNCAAFGCPANVVTMIANADSAYASGSQASILIHAGLLDTYNNSGDTIVIGNAGSATPQLSKSLANIPFWDTP